MLNIPQLAQIKGRDPYLYESLKQVVGAVNSLGVATGVDPSGSIAPPSQIGGVSVVAADGIFDIAITDNSSAARAICASRSATRRFTGAHTANTRVRRHPRPSRLARRQRPWLAVVWQAPRHSHPQAAARQQRNRAAAASASIRC